MAEDVLALLRRFRFAVVTLVGPVALLVDEVLGEAGPVRKQHRSNAQGSLISLRPSLWPELYLHSGSAKARTCNL